MSNLKYRRCFFNSASERRAVSLSKKLLAVSLSAIFLRFSLSGLRALRENKQVTQSPQSTRYLLRLCGLRLSLAIGGILDSLKVDFFHLQHRVHRATGSLRIGITDQLRQRRRRYLPRQAKFVF